MYLNYHKTSVEIKELQKWNQLEKQEELVEHHVEERIKTKHICNVLTWKEE